MRAYLHIGRDCVKSLRSSYTGKYPQSGHASRLTPGGHARCRGSAPRPLSQRGSGQCALDESGDPAAGPSPRRHTFPCFLAPPSPAVNLD